MLLKFHNSKIIETIKNFMITTNQTLAVAESVTSGLLQLAFSNAYDARKFFQGGITTYNLGQKTRHLLIDPIQAQICDSVSEIIAIDMAHNVCKLFSSNWGIGITGYATPAPCANNKLFAYYAICHDGQILISEKIEAREDEPLKVQIFYTDYVLSNFANHLNLISKNDSYVS